jgi:hypothetical protein
VNRHEQGNEVAVRAIHQDLGQPVPEAIARVVNRMGVRP